MHLLECEPRERRTWFPMRLSPGTTESLQRRPQHNEAIIRQRAMQKRARAEAKLALYLKTQPGTAKAAAAKVKLAAFTLNQTFMNFQVTLSLTF